jgi:hypothetical protein
MPETYGKRQRKAAQERKAVERDARRVARAQRRETRVGEPDDMSWLADPPNYEDDPPKPRRERETETPTPERREA